MNLHEFSNSDILQLFAFGQRQRNLIQQIHELKNQVLEMKEDLAQIQNDFAKRNELLEEAIQQHYKTNHAVQNWLQTDELRNEKLDALLDEARRDNDADDWWRGE